jgi:hypothetical protein
MGAPVVEILAVSAKFRGKSVAEGIRRNQRGVVPANWRTLDARTALR